MVSTLNVVLEITSQSALVYLTILEIHMIDVDVQSVLRTLIALQLSLAETRSASILVTAHNTRTVHQETIEEFVFVSLDILETHME